MTIKANILITTLLLFGHFVFGQFSSKIYTVNDGLSINEVTDLYIDQQMHYLWVCTNNGLNRFDGHSFEPKYIQRKEGKVSHFINALVEDHNHHFWVATNRGLARYDYQRDQWLPLHSDLEVGIYTQVEVVNDTLLYAVRDNDDLIEVNLKTNDFRVVKTPLFEGILQLESFENTLLIGGWKGLYSYAPSTQKLEVLGRKYIKNALFIKYLEDQTLWIRDNDQLMYIPIEAGVPQFSKGININASLKDQDTPKFHISDIEVFQDGYLFCDDSKLKMIHKADILNPKLAENIQISPLETVKIVVDQYENIWCATWKEGFYQLQQREKPFKSVALNSNDKQEAPLRFVKGFSEIENSEILMVTEKNTYFIFNKEKGTIKLYHEELFPAYSDKKALQLRKDWKGRIWTGNHQIGTRVVYGPDKEKINQLITQNTSKTRYLAVNDFSIDASQRKIHMVGASNILSFDDDKFTFETKKIDARRLYCIEKEKRSGHFWLGSAHGLQVFDENLEVKLQEYEELIHQAGLEDTRINCLYQDESEVLWIGTYGDGLYYYEEKSKKISAVVVPEYLDVKVIYSIIDDQEQSTLWISTNSGLLSYQKSSETFKKYSKEDGVLDNQFCYRSSFRANDGTLFFGEANGFTYFHPKDLRSKKTTLPTPQFSDFYIGQQKTNLVDFTKQNTIEIKDKSFEFNFFTPELSNAESYTYAYFLEGFDQEYQYAHRNTPKAVYHNVPPGKYRLKVKVIRPFSDWSEEVFSPWLRVPLPWYKTTTAYVGFTLLFLFIFVLSIWIIKVQLHLKNTVVMAQLEQRNTEEISRTKLRFFTDITHEIRTPLTLILSPLNALLENRKFDVPTQKSLNTIQKSAKRLSSLVDELLLFRKAEENNLHLKLEEVDVHLVMEDICDWFSYEAEVKEIAIEYFSEDTPLSVVMDREMMEKVLSNLVSNALKFTKAGGRITLSCHQELETTVIKIEDNGKGMNEEEVDRIFNRFYELNPSEYAGFGIGLELSQRIVLAHKGEISVESQLHQGSTFIIKIPTLTANVNTTPQVDITEKQYLNMDIHKEEFLPSMMEGKLLIVEDDAEIRDYIAGIFKERFTVVTMKNGQEGLFYAQSNAVDMIISDYQMPMMNGVEMCQHLKSDISTSHIPIVLLSAFNEVEDQLRGLEVGADDYVEKPFDEKILYFKITNLLNTRQQLLNSFEQGQPLDLEGLNQQDQRFIKQLTQIIDQEIQNENLSVDFVAEKMKTSRTTLNSKLKGLLNVTTSEYIRKEKLKEAYRLLVKEEYNVTEAANAVGFSYAYFNTIFKKEFGVPPGKL
ncbi:ATP-binding protein [Flammeovirga sp. EKP202]|uniref:hybrid sensor histidine kinase/response regulator transcription factor n=1 Tax=Flammeovirga sp. EKP202 TaxID=2770592 RepID=UPI00165EE221|nr:ATP-binding protein [Flammeovirga sp. EKP202]MBD0405129.1 response regulator [Flammeovirga sp. EKP202]